MARLATLGPVLLLAVALVTPADVLAQTKDDTIVYALQSDMQNWDPPNSVLRESIIMGYNVFDHLAARDLKTGKVGPSLALSWKSIDDTLGPNPGIVYMKWDANRYVTQPGSPEFRTALRDAIENLKEFVGSQAVFNLSDKDHNGVDQRSQVLVRIENGQWKLVR